MSTRRITTTNNTTLYLIGAVVIIVAFLLLGGWPVLKGLVSQTSSIGTTNWNWSQILISLGIGLILGLLIAKRRW